jgi:hypothetical protein
MLPSKGKNMKLATVAWIAAAFATGSAQAVTLPSHIYEFSGTSTDANGGPAMTLSAGSSYVGTGVTQGVKFGKNLGPTLNGALANPGVYSVEMFFSLEAGSTAFIRLLDFNNGANDAGLYLEHGDVTFYGSPVGNTRADTNIGVNTMTHLVVTRDASRIFRAYVNGAQTLSFVEPVGNQPSLFSTSNGLIRFFHDNGSEAAPGFLDYVRLYNEAISAADVKTLYGGGSPLRDFNTAVPEPATWAMLMLGFGATGATLRHRRRAIVQHAA